MDPITVCIKSIDRTERSQSNFNVKFGHVLPNTGTVFKCVVSNFFARGSEIVIPVPGVGVAQAYALVVDFPFINYYSTSGNLHPILFVNTDDKIQFEFYTANINQQTINFRLITVNDITLEDLEDETIFPLDWMATLKFEEVKLNF